MKRCLQLFFFLSAAGCAAAELSLEQVVVICGRQLPQPQQKAVQMLVEEVEKRAQIRWPVVHEWPAAGTPVILIGQAAEVAKLGGARLPAGAATGAEGFQIQTASAGAAPVVAIRGHDDRGVLFGAGYLLRQLRMERGKIRLPGALQVITAPKYRLRGHQLGYRPKTNSYDGWTVAMWEQYYRDLAVFGTNAVELIPPRSDDDDDSPHFPVPPMRMMIEMSRLAQEYGLELWIWYPAMDKDYADPATVEFALKEWGEVFRQLPRVDAVFVPGGDPGHTQPRHLMALLEKQTANLKRYHPRAQMWMSPQGFTAEWMDEYLEIMRKEPAWLTGVVFGPQIRLSLAELRAAIPKRYPIRAYPDITHSLHAQYPVPEWDTAFARTLGREPINPRPLDQANIFRKRQHLAEYGFLTYSEGCNDDVNKFIWSALGWDPDADVTNVLREFSRYFISGTLAEGFAQGLLALEKNWRGPALTNAGIHTTLRQFQAMEQSAPPPVKANWRFQQALYRAYYDAFVRSRLIRETALEEQAMEALRQAPRLGSRVAIAQAQAALDRAVTEPAAPELRARVFELAEALFQSIRMQLSVPRYQAIAVRRGANLDAIDTPLNSRFWLEARFAEILRLDDEKARLAGIQDIVDWTNPGPGGFYDDLGRPGSQPHLVRGVGADEDPAFRRTALLSFATLEPEAPWRSSWWDHAEALIDAKLTLRYEALDRHAAYQLRVVYAGEAQPIPMRLVADGKFELHGYRPREMPPRPVEFDIPREATADGALTLEWNRTPGLGGSGRGCQVAEVWLIKKK